VRVGCPAGRDLASVGLGDAAALPKAFSAPDHTHRAEETATVLEGIGSTSIDGTTIDVAQRPVVVTPPHAHHVTIAGRDGPMVVFRMYVPARSEQRWLAQSRD